MSLPSAEQVTNLYLYGQEMTPSDKTSEALIRDSSTTMDPVPVDVNAYMSGPGRFASAANFNIVEYFFNPSLYPQFAALASGRTYSKSELYAIFNLTTISQKIVTIDQAMYDDGKDDFLARAYIWNTTAFQIDDRATFTISASGERTIANFAIEPYNNDGSFENFDFEAGSIFGNIVNSVLEDKVDPSGIGHRVDFTFDLTARAVDTFSYADYIRSRTSTTPSNPLLYAYIAANSTAFLDRLYRSGATRFLDTAGRTIIYGTDDQDTLSSATFDNVAIDRNLRVAMDTKGVALIAGKGADTLTGGIRNDALYGGEGDDSLNGGLGGDWLYGGAGNDSYQLTSGELFDVIQDSDGNGTITVDGTLLKGGKKAAEGYWISEDKKWGYSLTSGGDLIISKGSSPDTITIRNWQANGGSKLGITLEEGSPTVPANSLIGDRDEAGALDLITGTAGDDHIQGLGGDDALLGLDGDDLVEGGEGNDILMGGLGQDTLTYQFSRSFGADTVVDADGSGTIKLNSIDLTGGNKIGDGIWQNAAKTVIYTFLAGSDGKWVGVLSCKNHRKNYKKHSNLGNKYAGYSRNFHSKRLSIFQAANSMKEVRI